MGLESFLGPREGRLTKSMIPIPTSHGTIVLVPGGNLERKTKKQIEAV